MNFHYQIFKVLYAPHISEKSTIYAKKNNIIILKVSMKSNKRDIKRAVEKLFSVQVKNINTVLVKGKRKIKGKYNIKFSNWKKAYIKLKAGNSVDIIKNIN
ncbi:50S ribosomal protein L23 [Buchnera aphidicola (Pterocallis alni)]|uniref:50S ribosomal protein L23 n=1 Tax=Buchnera aphidicola TaxID=9 RepID=UPI003463F296